MIHGLELTKDQIVDQVGYYRSRVRAKVIQHILDQVENQVWEKVNLKAYEQMWDRACVLVYDQVRNQVRDPVDDLIGFKICNQIFDQMWRTHNG